MLRLQFLIELHGIIITIFVLLFYRINAKRDKDTDLIAQALLVNGFVLFWDIMAYRQQGIETVYSFRMHVVSNFFLYALEYLISFIITYYFYRVLKKYTGISYKNLIRISYVIGCFLMCLLIANLFTGCFYFFDQQNFYHRGPLFPLNVLVQILWLGVGFFRVMYHRRQIPKQLFRSILAYTMAPFVGVLLQLLFFGFSFYNVATTVCVLAFLGFNVHEMNEDARKKEKILLQTRTSLMGAQMNPHFVFNSLSVIRYLMEEDVPTAQDALVHFSKYLRNSIEINPDHGLITLGEELEIAKEYIYMEKLRFGDAVEVSYDIEDMEIRLPFLTIEPLVENAIKHGLRKRTGKGNVLIKSWKDGKENVIVIRDNGVGFDTNILELTETKSRIGIQNVRERIRILCDGTMKIISFIGKGTTVEIRIPIPETEL